MITEEKFEKILKSLDKLISDLAANQKLPVHSNVNQFYYMQKIEELKVLKERLDEEIKRLKFVEANFEEACHEVFLRWQKDARWLNMYLENPSKTESAFSPNNSFVIK